VAGNDSRIPVLMTVGFALGLGFGAVLFRPAPPAPPSQSTPSRKQPGPGEPLDAVPNLPSGVASVGEVELQFRTWGGYAIWKNNLTQFALWNPQTDRHTDFYEVRRANRLYYFRTLSKEDWPLIDHGEMARCPLWFAEPREVREAYYRDHPEEKPGLPIFRSVSPRTPLLPSLPPMLDTNRSPLPDRGDHLVPPWDAPVPTEGRK
jgi:hypothetical protein